MRRALGARRRHVRAQFLTEAVVLALLGGLACSALGAAATASYAWSQSEQTVVPAFAVVGGILLLGGILMGQRDVLWFGLFLFLPPG